MSCFQRLLFLASGFDHLAGVVDPEQPEVEQRIADVLSRRLDTELVGDPLGFFLGNVNHHVGPPPFKPPGAATPGMSERHGVSFDEATWERIAAKAGDDAKSPIIDRLCWFGLEAEAELARRGIHIDSADERAEFLLDRLEEGLDAWNA